MDVYEFDDALTGTSIACGFPEMAASVTAGPGIEPIESIFFPGCSFVNYMTPLVRSVTDLLTEAGEVQGVSLLCCGKILEYEPNGKTVRASFEEQFREHVKSAGVKRIVAACPNCVYALRGLLSADEETSGVVVVPLPRVLADLGYRIDEEISRRLVASAYRSRSYAGDNSDELGASAVADELDAGRTALFAVHDSCPDRETGEFADAVRELMGEGSYVEQEHNRKQSLCCGSRVRAVGKFEAAGKLAQKNGAESKAAGGDAIVTPCVSCAYLLSALQKDVPVFHYLELLYDWRVDWEHAEQYMKLRFLFDVEEQARSTGGGRAFVGIGSADAMTNDETEA